MFMVVQGCCDTTLAPFVLHLHTVLGCPLMLLHASLNLWHSDHIHCCCVPCCISAHFLSSPGAPGPSADLSHSWSAPCTFIKPYPPIPADQASRPPGPLGCPVLLQSQTPPLPSRSFPPSPLALKSSFLSSCPPPPLNLHTQLIGVRTELA